MHDIELKLLDLFDRERGNHQQVSNIIRNHGDQVNFTGVNGPIFNLLLDMRPFFTIGHVIEMLRVGFSLDHPNNRGTVHRAFMKRINEQCSTEMIEILELLCSSANFIETLPKNHLLDYIFQSDICVNCDVLKLLLKYDKTKRIKIALLMNCNKIICNNLQQFHNELYKLIINS